MDAHGAGVPQASFTTARCCPHLPPTACLLGGLKPLLCRFQAGCMYFGGLIYEDPKAGNKLYYNGGCE